MISVSSIGRKSDFSESNSITDSIDLVLVRAVKICSSIYFFNSCWDHGAKSQFQLKCSQRAAERIHANCIRRSVTAVC
jgi:hypothetical protein